MRHLDKSYPYQKPSKNRSSKNCNLLLGRASVFPAYLSWSDKDLARFAAKCRNKANVFQETLDARAAARNAKRRGKARPAGKKEEEAKHE